jgi:hypothetical protein
MKFWSSTTFCLLALPLCGCATLGSGTEQYIAISTPPVNSAYCVLTRPGDSWIATTPGVIRIEKSQDDIAVRCTHVGYQDAVATIPAEFENWALGNLAFGGVTVAVDAATGALNSYPQRFVLPMTPGVGSADAQPVLAAPAYAAAAPPPAAPAPAPRPALPGTMPNNF